MTKDEELEQLRTENVFLQIFDYHFVRPHASLRVVLVQPREGEGTPVLSPFLPIIMVIFHCVCYTTQDLVTCMQNNS